MAPVRPRSAVCLGLFAASSFAACGEDDGPLPGEAEDRHLLHEVTQWMPGLGETVTIRKTPLTVEVLRSDGTRLPYADLLDRDAAAHRSQHGALSIELDERARSAPPGEEIPVVLYANLPALRALERDLPDEARAQPVSQLLAFELEELATSLGEFGFRETYRAIYAPYLLGTFTAESLLAVAFDPRILFIHPDDPVEGSELALTDPVKHHKIDSVWNASGNFGGGVKVGLIEACQFDGTNRFLFDEHQAFGFNAAPVTYSTYPSNQNRCNSHSDCTCNSRCENNRCVTRHGSQVASIISASRSTRHGAANVSLYLYNDAAPIGTGGHQAHIDTYDFMVKNGVKTVNESFLGGSNTAADDYARRYGISVVKGAGNLGNLGGQVACENTLNASCVGSVSSSGTVSCFSNWENSSITPDREEPDVVALGGDSDATCSGTYVDTVQALDFASTTDWSGFTAGTSAAAPSVTSMIAHARVACTNINLTSRVIRALLRSAAWAANPADGRYSTPSLTEDFADGAGYADAATIDWFCQQPPGNGVGEGTVDLTKGDSMLPGKSTYTPGKPKPQSGLGGDVILDEREPQATQLPGDTSFARRYATLHKVDLKVGDRVRYTIAWDACPPTSGSKYFEVKADLDLFLYNATTKTYVYGSQSIHDNNEGFDVTISASDGAGSYIVMLAWPDGARDCSSTTTMRYAWAARMGSPW